MNSNQFEIHYQMSYRLQNEEIQRDNELLAKVRRADDACEKLANIFICGDKDLLPRLHPNTRLVRKSALT